MVFFSSTSHVYAFSKKLGYKLLIDDETGIAHDIGKAKKRSRNNWKPKYELDIFNLSSEDAKAVMSPPT